MRVSIIGTGYVGLGTGLCLANLGNDVICVDKCGWKIDKLNSGELITYEPGLQELLTKCISEKKVMFTKDLDYAIKNSEISIICVGTPDKDGTQDLSQIEEVSISIGKCLREKDDYHVVIVKSTVIPTTTDSIVKVNLEMSSNKLVGDFGLGMNPEFLRQGSAVYDFMNPGRIIIGAYDDKSRDVMLELYKSFNCPKLIMNPRTAEVVKYACNSLLATLISFTNEFANLCEYIEDVDVIDVIKGLRSDYKFTVDGVEPPSNSYIWPGCGYGGSCFPKDVKAIHSFSKSVGYNMNILKETIRVNESQPYTTIYNIFKNLNSWKDKKVCVLGLAYKPDTDDMRESPAIPIIKKLIEWGAIVKAHDPEAIDNAINMFLPNLKIQYCHNVEDAMKDVEVIFVITPWKEYKELDFKCDILVDCRRIYDKDTIKKTGTKYIGVGLCDNKL